MTSSNGNIFRVPGLFCGEFTGHRWIPRTKASDAELWCFLWYASEATVEKTMKTPVIWDAIPLIMTSLYWIDPGQCFSSKWHEHELWCCKQLNVIHLYISLNNQSVILTNYSSTIAWWILSSRFRSNWQSLQTLFVLYFFYGFLTL